MKVVIVYRPNSEHGRGVEQFIHDFRDRHPETKLEILNIDSREGAALAALYDVVAYPALMVLQEDGYAQKIWQGEALPMIDEVFAYSNI